MKPSEVNFVIYHRNCPDGFCSAKCAEKYCSKNNNKPMFYAGQYGIPPPFDQIAGKNVLICDFSYKKDILIKMLSIVNKLLILDHHKTAFEDLEDIPESNKIFDMNHSGAYITWKYFFENDHIPLCILYIEDNDMWWHKMPNTLEFKYYVQSLPFTFDSYEKLFDDNYIENEVIPQGTGMMKLNNAIIEKSIKYATPKFMEINSKYYFIAYLNATELKSELGNKIFSEYPNINFSAVYSHNDQYNSTNYSLRSINTATDVSDIAKLYGGGGHRNASGVSVNYITNVLPSHVIDNSKTYFLLDNIYGKEHLLDNTKYNVIYLNSTHYKHQLAKYLLQIRYDNIQECQSILKNKGMNYADIYDAAVIWNYDGNNMLFTVYFREKSIRNKIIEIFKPENLEEYKGTIVFSHKILNNCLNI